MRIRTNTEKARRHWKGDALLDHVLAAHHQSSCAQCVVYPLADPLYLACYWARERFCVCGWSVYGDRGRILQATGVKQETNKWPNSAHALFSFQVCSFVFVLFFGQSTRRCTAKRRQPQRQRSMRPHTHWMWTRLKESIMRAHVVRKSLIEGT